MPKDPSDSTMSVRSPNPEHFNFAHRRLSKLPFVSWEEGALHRADEESIDSLEYPLDPSVEGGGLDEDPRAQAEAFMAAIRALIKSGAAAAFHLKPEDVVSRCLPPIVCVHPRTHHGLTRPFYSWAVQPEKLFALAGLHFLTDPAGLGHLVEPTDCALRFSQGGDGLIGVRPRFAAWRSWRNFESERVLGIDLLMDLQSFAWYSLQHSVPHARLILGGSHRLVNRASLVYAVRRMSGSGWLVDALPADREYFSDSAIVLMS